MGEAEAEEEVEEGWKLKVQPEALVRDEGGEEAGEEGHQTYLEEVLLQLPREMQMSYKSLHSMLVYFLKINKVW